MVIQARKRGRVRPETRYFTMASIALNVHGGETGRPDSPQKHHPRSDAFPRPHVAKLACARGRVRFLECETSVSTGNSSRDSVIGGGIVLPQGSKER